MGKNHNFPKFSDILKILLNGSKIRTNRFYHREKHLQKMQMEMQTVKTNANSADPDETAPIGAVSSGYALFA